MIKCSICGDTEYTKGGNTAGGLWVFTCRNGHRWRTLGITTKQPFPWREQKKKAMIQ